MSEIGADFDPVSMGIVKAIKVVSTLEGTELLVTFWDRGALAVRAKMGEHCTLDVRPSKDSLMGAYYSGLVHGAVDRMEDPRLYDAARDACHACGMPWTDPRTGVTYAPPKTDA